MDKRRTTEFDDEVKELYELLRTHEKTIVSPVFSIPKLSHPESKRKVARYILFPFAVVMVVTVVWWFFEPSELLKLCVLLLTLLGYVGIVAIQLLELYAEKDSILQFLKNPLVEFTNSLIKEAAIELKLVSELRNFSVASLEFVRRSLETGHQVISHRIGIMVGAMEKIGMLPGLVTLYFAASVIPPKNNRV